MRLIDADEFKEYIENGILIAFIQAPLEAEKVQKIADGIIKDIDEQPTVEAVPVIHAKWIKEKHRKNEMTSRTCSNCGMSEGGTTIKGNYCWYCGAKMDKEIEDVKD